MFVYDSAEKQMLNAISLVIEQRKNEFDRIAKVRFFQNVFLCLARVISLSGHLPGSIFSRESDIASTKLQSCNKTFYQRMLLGTSYKQKKTLSEGNKNAAIECIAHDTFLE